MIVKNINEDNMNYNDWEVMFNHTKLIILDNSDRVLVHKVGDYIELPTFDTVSDQVSVDTLIDYASDILCYNFKKADIKFYFMERCFYKKEIPEDDISANTIDKTKFYIINFDENNIRQGAQTDYVKDVYFVPINDFVSYLSELNLKDGKADETTMQLLRLFNDYGIRGELKHK